VVRLATDDHEADPEPFADHVLPVLREEHP
jgi:hypothetical protein